MSFEKKMLSAAALVTVATGLARVIAFLAVPVFTHALGKESYGYAALVTTVISLSSSLAMLGIDTGYMRFYLQDSAEKTQVIEKFCWQFAVIGAVCSGAMAGLYWSYTQETKNGFVSCYIFFSVIVTVLVAMTTVRTRLNDSYGRLALAQPLSAISGILAGFVALYIGYANEWVIFVSAFITMVITLAICQMPNPCNFYHVSSLSKDKKFEIIKLGLASSITAPVFWLLTSSDRWFIARYESVSAVGIYSVAVSIATLGLVINTSIFSAWFPEATRLYHDDKSLVPKVIGENWERLMALMLLVWFFLASIGGDVLKFITASEFHAGAGYIPLLAGAFYFYGLVTLNTTSLYLENRMRVVALVWVIGGCINILLNYILVRHYGAFGAAIVQCISFALVGCFMFIFGQHALRLVINWPRMLGLVAFVFFIALFTMKSWSEVPLISILYKSPVVFSCIALVIINVVLRNHPIRLVDLFCKRT
jgi:O-antigen/teichoic acid export membrane protein